MCTAGESWSPAKAGTTCSWPLTALITAWSHRASHILGLTLECLALNFKKLVLNYDVGTSYMQTCKMS